MASISKIEGKWRALIRRKGYPTISKRFDTKAKAAAWARDIEGQIVSGAPVKLHTKKETIAQLIDKYIKLRASTRPILDTSTEHYTLKQLRASLGDIVAANLTVDDLVGWAQSRKDGGEKGLSVGPYTINCDLSKLGTVYRYAGDGLPDAIGLARPKLSYLGLIGGGNMRERRPTEDEIIRIIEWLQREKGQIYADLVRFHILTAMRRNEATQILWSDLDHEKKMVLIRDRKDPRQKIGNDQWIPLLGGAWELALSQPKGGDPRIFPLHKQTVSKYFTNACTALSIPDLHLHDLRHEGISKMFEIGYQIQQVAIVSGHKDWRHLRRYTQIKPESLHDHGKRQDS